MDAALIASSRKLVVEYRAVADIKPDPRNARTHPKRQIEQLAAAIRRFGFTNPILADEGYGTIAGHGRLLAANMLGLTEVPVIVIARLTEAEKKALRLADNKIGEGSAWNTELVTLELQAIKELDVSFNLELTGFRGPEIDTRVFKRVDEDEPLGEPPPARARLGDVFVAGEHRIGCGDSRDPAFLAKIVGWGPRVDAAFLDAPYNVSIRNHANVKARHGEFAMASGEMSKPEFIEFLTACFKAAASVSKDGAVHFCAMDWRHMDEMLQAGDAAYGDLINLCVWAKSNPGMGSLYRSQHELIFVYKVGTAPHFNAVELGRHGRNRSNLWPYPSVNTFNKARQAELALHPTPKSVVMVADAIKDVTRPGEVVLDSFLGSGTTLIAAEQIGRKFRGCDIDPAYVDIALERWARLTGQEPMLESRVAEEAAA